LKLNSTHGIFKYKNMKGVANMTKVNNKFSSKFIYAATSSEHNLES